jgi:hypothetical protein
MIEARNRQRPTSSVSHRWSRGCSPSSRSVNSLDSEGGVDVTAVVMPEDGTIHFAEDIYGHDAKLDKALTRTRLSR